MSRYEYGMELRWFGYEMLAWLNLAHFDSRMLREWNPGYPVLVVAMFDKSWLPKSLDSPPQPFALEKHIKKVYDMWKDSAPERRSSRSES